MNQAIWIVVLVGLASCALVAEGDASEKTVVKTVRGNKVCMKGWECPYFSVHCCNETISDFFQTYQFENLFSKRNTPVAQAVGFYDYQSFITATIMFQPLGFCTTGGHHMQMLELAAFLGHVGAKTSCGYGVATGGPTAWGLCFNRELSPSQSYCDENYKYTYPCSPGAEYFGRGALPVYWNVNYGAIGEGLKVDLLHHPELLEKNATLAFMSAIYKWMTSSMAVGSPCSSETSSMAVGSVGSLCSNETSSSFVNSSLPDDQLLISRGSSPIPVHVVIVMDALKGFSWGPLLWALDHFQETGCTITLLGVMPWIPLALSCKSWQDVWGIREPYFGALSTPEGPIEWKNDQKSQKMKGIVQLCQQKGVIPCMRVAMGHPMRLLVLEQTTSLNATFVVLDRHLRKNKRFFAERLPSDVVMMNRDGRRVDMLKIRSMMDNQEYSTPADHHYSSPATIPPSPQIILSHELTQLLRRMQNPWKKNEKIIKNHNQEAAKISLTLKVIHWSRINKTCI